MEKQLRKRFPEAVIALDRPARRSGTWFLDVTHGGHPVVVQWRESSGFGVSASPRHGFGEGPDEVYQEVEAAYSRVVSLLLSRGSTSPPEAVRLSELRKERGISQAKLAAVLNKQQGAVSKIERRHDMLVSTLRDVVQSMGGTLRIIARFPGGVERALEFEEEPPEGARQTIKQSRSAPGSGE